MRNETVFPWRHKPNSIFRGELFMLNRFFLNVDSGEFLIRNEKFQSQSHSLLKP